MPAANASAKEEFGKQWQGQTVDGRFPLEQYLGGSEQTAVFLTKFPAAAKGKAVIKLVAAKASDSEPLLANWKRAAQLSHPHLLQLFDGGRCWLSGRELLYVVTEFADENLAQVLPHRALTAAEAEAMLRPVVEALAYLHERGLVQGDLRPANVMAVNDQLKLASESIQASGGAPRRTSPPPYDAPEIAAVPVASPGDIWSLGVTLTEALTQRVPQGNTSADVANLPPPFGEIARHCLVKNPDARWTVQDIAGAIRLKLTGTQPPKKVENTGDAAPSPALSGPRGRRPVSLLAVLAVVGAVLAIALVFKVFQHVPEAAKPAESAPAPVAAQPAIEKPAQPAVSEPGTVLHKVLPAASKGALNTIQGRVKVRVRMRADAAGNVANVQYVSAGPSKYFARLSMEAAQQWKFAPPVANGQATASEWDVLFEFTRSGVEAFPQQAKSR